MVGVPDWWQLYSKMRLKEFKLNMMWDCKKIYQTQNTATSVTFFKVPPNTAPTHKAWGKPQESVTGMPVAG